MKDIKILVATHKKYDMPDSDIYLPIHVGKEGKKDLGYIGDNTGDHISYKNQSFCELTGLYWAWKNLNCKYIGLSHYRRYFTYSNVIIQTFTRKQKLILSESKVKEILADFDIILPIKRNYVIESIRSHYKNAHHIKDLDETRVIIKERHPEYLGNFDRVMAGTKIHLYNMFIMRKDMFDEYCDWLFDILFELETRIDITSYSSYQSRVFGFISERLFNVWLDKHKYENYTLNVMNLDNVNWAKKILNFIDRKVRSTNGPQN